MSEEPLNKLLSISGPAISDAAVYLSSTIIDLAGLHANDLRGVLELRNGFYAFESALHVFTSSAHEQEIDLAAWNSDGLWREAYADLAANCLFFAEDIFGGQFCVKDGKVQVFDSETGSTEHFADTIDGWARKILDDYEVATGWPIANAWQRQNGALSAGKRLMPKIPFVLGGEYTIENLVQLDAVQAMRFRADLALQIRDLPDGAQIKLKIVD